MNKIAILTLYYNNFNYGGVLQAYALQKKIEELGFSAKQISYRIETGITDWKPINWEIRKCLSKVYYYIKFKNWMKQFENRRKKIISFAEKIPHTEIVKASNINKLSKEYDCFICGSDQIWNPIGWQSVFFFDFLPKNKPRFSYAASVARDSLSEQQLEYMRKYLSKFSTISVRESNTADILNNRYSDLNVCVMPDPVILLTKEQWKAIMVKPLIDEKYILAYFLGHDEMNREKAIQYAESHKLKIFFVSHIDKKDYIWEKKHRKSLAPIMGIEEFISSIANAEMVLTDSFHGAVFSSIFNIPFYVMSRFKKDDQLSMNSRVISLLKELGIPERNCDDIGKVYDYKWKEEEVKNINFNLERLRKKGIDFLQSTFLSL